MSLASRTAIAALCIALFSTTAVTANFFGDVRFHTLHVPIVLQTYRMAVPSNKGPSHNGDCNLCDRIHMLGTCCQAGMPGR